MYEVQNVNLHCIVDQSILFATSVLYTNVKTPSIKEVEVVHSSVILKLVIVVTDLNYRSTCTMWDQLQFTFNFECNLFRRFPKVVKQVHCIHKTMSHKVNI